MIRFFILSILFILSSSGLQAAHTSIHFHVDSPAAETFRGLLRMSSTGGSAPEEASVKSFEVAIPGVTQTDLFPGSMWKIELEADGYWAFPRIIRAGTEKEVNLRVQQTGQLVGQIEGYEPTATTLRSIDVRFTEKSLRTGAQGLRGAIGCPVAEDGSWTCQLPAGLWDLRLRAAGYIPHYLWDQTIEAQERTTLGSARWQEGASLAGWVITQEDGLPSEECRVSLNHQNSGSLDIKATQLKHSAQVNAVGFFQFDGLAPGTYRLEVRDEGFTLAIREQIVILPEQEATLSKPVVLQKPINTTFQVIPAQGPEGAAWRIELLSGFPGASHLAASGETDTAGLFIAENLVPGSFMLVIRDALGDRKVFEEIIVDQEGHRIYEIPTIWVEGQVSLGDTGIPAQLYFGGRSGAVSVRMDADEDGKFAGILPRDGEWRVDVLSRHPSIFRSLHSVDVDTHGGSVAEVEIELADTTVEVEVVDEGGKEFPGARVLLMRSVSPPEAPSWGDTDSDGLYVLHGLGLAEYHVEAHFRDGEATLASDTMKFQLAKGSPEASVQLVLRESRRLTGQVVSPIGVGVPGAAIETQFPRNMVSPGLLRPSAQADTSGRFEIEVPHAVTAIKLIVRSPGYVLQSVDIGPDHGELTISLTQLGGGSLTVSRDENLKFWEGSHVVYENTTRFGLSTLIQWARENGNLPDASGQILVPYMPVGRYELCANGSHSNKKCLEAVLGMDQHISLLSPDNPDGTDSTEN